MYIREQLFTTTKFRTVPELEVPKFVINIKHLLSRQKNNLNILNTVGLIEMLANWNEIGGTHVQTWHESRLSQEHHFSRGVVLCSSFMKQFAHKYMKLLQQEGTNTHNALKKWEKWHLDNELFVVELLFRQQNWLLKLHARVSQVNLRSTKK